MGFLDPTQTPAIYLLPVAFRFILSVDEQTYNTATT